jgi:hypothetical protein
MSLVRDHRPPTLGLGTGQAGVALALLDRGRIDGNTGMVTDALRMADNIVAAVRGEVFEGVPPADSGLYDGPTGLALLLIRCYEHTGLERYLDVAHTALQQDLDRCRPHANGALYLMHAGKKHANLAAGSGGLAMVIDEFLHHRTSDVLGRSREELLGGLAAEQAVECGLFIGRAGLIAVLQRCRPGARDTIDAQITGLRYHAVSREGKLFFPGRLCRRLSVDLATGSAGVLIALHAAITGSPPALPLLTPPSPARLPEHSTAA